MLVLPSPTSLVLAWVRPRLSWRWGRSRAFGPLQGWHRGSPKVDQGSLVQGPQGLRINWRIPVQPQVAVPGSGWSALDMRVLQRWPGGWRA